MENNTQPRAIYSIKQNGKELRGLWQDRLMQLTLTENRGPKADKLTIELDDSKGDLAIPHRGITLTLAIGWESTGLIDKGTFVVDDVEHSGAPDVLSISAHSADLRTGITKQKERSWHGATVNTIVNSIAAEHQLLSAISPVLAKQAITHIDQTNESDANLLTRLASMFDAVFTVKHGRLLFTQKGTGKSATSQALTPVSITRASGDSHRFNVADSETTTGVKANYYDLKAATKGHVIVDDGEETADKITETDITTVTATGRTYTLKRQYKSKGKALGAARHQFRQLQGQNKNYQTVIAHYKINSGKSATAIVTAKNLNSDDLYNTEAATNTPYEPSAALTASAISVKTLRHVYANKTNATRAATAEYKRIKRGASVFELSLQGRPDISPEQPATLSGWKPEIDSTQWIVSQATHSINDSAGMLSGVHFELKIE